jgi:hypothetical protein
MDMQQQHQKQTQGMTGDDKENGGANSMNNSNSQKSA